MLDKFSVSNWAKKKKKQESNPNYNESGINLNGVSSVTKKGLSNEVCSDLLAIGFNMDQILTAFRIYKFQSTEEAIYIMTKDIDTGKYLHSYLANENFLCSICNESEKEHNIINEDPEMNMIKVSENEELQVLSRRKAQDEKEKTSEFLRSPYNNNLKLSTDLAHIKIQLPQNVLEELEDPNLCRICFSTSMNTINSRKFNCGHQVCKACIKQYLTIKIINGKVININCIFGGCAYMLTPKDINEFVDSDVYAKFEKFYINQAKILSNRNLTPCPFPDCDDLVQIDLNDEDTFYTCNNDHSFCRICKSNVFHKKGKCLSVKSLNLSF